MRKAFRHSGVLMMVAVVALGMLGAAYTLWYEQLTINATVSTGTLDADWSIHDWVDNGAEGAFSAASNANGVPADGKPVVYIVNNATTLEGGVATVMGTGGSSTGYNLFTQGNFPAGKPQPECSGVIGTDNSTGQANDQADDNTLNLTMNGLYPYAGCEFQIDIENNGTVPIHLSITDINVTVCDAGTPPTNCVSADPNALPWTRGFDLSLPDSAQCVEFFGAEWPWTGYTGTTQLPPFGPQLIGGTANTVQIHGGEDMLCGFKLVLDQNGEAEGKIYTVEINYVAHQWNETPNLPALFPPAP